MQKKTEFDIESRQFGGFAIHSTTSGELGQAIFHIALWEMVDIAV